MHKRTPFLSVLFTAIIGFLVIYFFEVPERPFTAVQTGLVFFFSLFPGIGFALLFDPFSRAAKKRYLKINFYDQNRTAEEMVEEIIAREAREKDK